MFQLIIFWIIRIVLWYSVLSLVFSLGICAFAELTISWVMKVEIFWERGSVPSIMMNTPDLVGLANFAYFCIISFFSFFFKITNKWFQGELYGRAEPWHCSIHILCLDTARITCCWGQNEPCLDNDEDAVASSDSRRRIKIGFGPRTHWMI